MARFVVECKVIIEANSYDHAMDQVEEMLNNFSVETEVEAAWPLESNFKWKD